MKVLVIGATGNFGLRLVPALLAHGHKVVAFVRSSAKLESLLPELLHRQLTVVEGSANDSEAIKKAILNTSCDAVINTAGLSAVAPWSHTDFPEIFRSVVHGVKDAGEVIGAPLRVWFLGGQSVLDYPGSEVMMSSYVPIFLEHCENYRLLAALPSKVIQWSMYCPNTMIPEDTTPATTSRAKLVASENTPPLWNDSWLRHIPFIGKALVSMMNVTRYQTTLEQGAEFIAADLESYESPWISKRVGIIDVAR